MLGFWVRNRGSGVGSKVGINVIGVSIVELWERVANAKGEDIRPKPWPNKKSPLLKVGKELSKNKNSIFQMICKSSLLQPKSGYFIVLQGNKTIN